MRLSTVLTVTMIWNGGSQLGLSCGRKYEVEAGGRGTINGIGERAGNAALEEIAVALEIRQDYFQVETDIVLNETISTSELVFPSQVFQC